MIQIEGIEAPINIIDELFAMDKRAEMGLVALTEDIANETKRRIQNDGQATNGSELYTRSRRRLGAYSEMWGTEREQFGLQTDHVDLTFTGDLMESFGVLSVRMNESEIGFNNSSESKKAERLESLYGTPIFDIERSVVDRELEKYENYILEK